MDQLNDLALAIGGQFWNIVACLAVILALYLGFRTKFVQFRLFGDALRLVKERITAKEKVDGVSGFQAFCVTLGGCIGTGNVAGVAMAIIVGGPGVVVWMWVIALLGACTSFVETRWPRSTKLKKAVSSAAAGLLYGEGSGQALVGHTLCVYHDRLSGLRAGGTANQHHCAFYRRGLSSAELYHCTWSSPE